MYIGNTADFFVDGTKLVNVTCFKYLGSYVSSDCSMKEELTSRIQAMPCAFGRLRKRVFDSHDHGSRPIGHPKLRFKDTCKSALKCGHVLDQWLSTVDNRAKWKRLTRVVCDAYNSKRVKDYEKRRARRRDKQRKTVDIPVFGL